MDHYCDPPLLFLQSLRVGDSIVLEWPCTFPPTTPWIFKCSVRLLAVLLHNSWASADLCKGRCNMGSHLAWWLRFQTAECDFLGSDPHIVNTNSPYLFRPHHHWNNIVIHTTIYLKFSNLVSLKYVGSWSRTVAKVVKWNRK